jgi:hypothetical protein
MATVIQRSAFPPGKYRGRLLNAAKLRAFVEGTNKALAAGVIVPALKKHSPLKADDAQLERHSATEGAGWLEKVEAEPNGALSWHIKDAPADVAKGIADGTVKFTSPEFRELYAAPDGRYTGPIIRHVAFTPQPAAPDQGPLTLALDDAYQFSDEDFEGPDDEEKKPEGSEPPAKEKNPDSPPTATNKSKVSAAIEGLTQLGIVLPSDFDFGGMDEPALDIIITGLNTACKAKADAEAKKPEADGDEDDEKVEQYPLAFSDEELAKLPEDQRKLVEYAKSLKAKVDQFSDDKASSLKEQTVAGIKSSKRLPPGLKTALLAKLDPIQFSDEGESPTLTIGEVAKLVSDSLPEQFGDEDTTAAEHQDGEAFFTGDPSTMTAEQATALAHRIHTRDKTAARAA